MIALNLALVLSTMAACATPASTLSEDGEAAIYAAVVRQVYTGDHTFGEPPNFPIVYLVRVTDDGVGDPDVARDEPRLLPEPIVAAVVAALDDLPAEFMWVDNIGEVSLNSTTGAVEDNGVIVTVGNIHLQEDGSVLVSATIYIANLAAGGMTYIVEQSNDVWQVTGDTGVQWIS